jgi:hypothetical protein
MNADPCYLRHYIISSKGNLTQLQQRLPKINQWICAFPNKRNFDENSILLILNKFALQVLYILANLDHFHLNYKNVLKIW